MKFKRVVPYNLKKMLPILGIAGIGAVSSCEKVEPIEMPKTSVEFEIRGGTNSNLVAETCEWNYNRMVPEIFTYADQEYIDTVYLVPISVWSYNSEAIHYIRKNFLEQFINYSPKIRGKGDFPFRTGEASKVPEDSLWFVQNGWTINQKQR